MKISRLSLVLFLSLLYACIPLKKTYVREVKNGLNANATTDSIIHESDLAALPAPIRHYLRYAGVPGKKKVECFKVRFTGKIRKDSASGWMDFNSVQYNFMTTPTRLFYMKARMKGLPVKGLHDYVGGKARMDIRLLSLFRVSYEKGPTMDTAETVTFFNDMCCLAPASLIDKRIQWTDLGDLKVKAVFTCNGICISAVLYFNEKGELINFISENRYAVQKDGSMKRLRWATPLSDYKDFNGYRLASAAKTIYSYPEGDFCYGTFELKSVEYELKPGDYF